MLASLSDWKSLSLVFGVTGAAAVAGHFVLHVVLRGVAGRAKNRILESAIRHCLAPLYWTVVLLAVRLVFKLPELRTPAEDFVGHTLSLALIALVSWLLIRGTSVLEDYVARRFDVSAADNLRARKVHTQLRVLQRIVVVIVGIVALGAMLMTFERIRQLGTALLASAGIVGIIIGMAAQKTIGTFLAGLQIAFTQPIRVDDVVIVEGEWGRIEEITLTYVVVRIWDQRRLIVPITHFIDKPFQNWTRVTADILGTVYLHVDYTVPVDAVRQELKRIVESAELWDEKVCVLQVTGASERTVELRALVSAADASAAWTLRCEVREKLVGFIQRQFPEALPRFRAELDGLLTGTGQPTTSTE